MKIQNSKFALVFAFFGILVSCTNDADTTAENGTAKTTANKIPPGGGGGIPDVYVAGYENDGSIANGLYTSKSWYNGVNTDLFSTTYNNIPNGAYYDNETIQSNSVFVNGIGGDVYNAGVVNNRAVYWKNGTAVYLTSGATKAVAKSIFVSGNDVYVAGYEQTSSLSSFTIAKLWKNGVATNLTNGTRALSVYVSGTNVYVAGYESNGVGTPRLWKNNIIVPLSIQIITM